MNLITPYPAAEFTRLRVASLKVEEGEAEVLEAWESLNAACAAFFDGRRVIAVVHYDNLAEVDEVDEAHYDRLDVTWVIAEMKLENALLVRDCDDTSDDIAFVHPGFSSRAASDGYSVTVRASILAFLGLPPESKEGI